MGGEGAGGKVGWNAFIFYERRDRAGLYGSALALHGRLGRHPSEREVSFDPHGSFSRALYINYFERKRVELARPEENYGPRAGRERERERGHR